MTLANMRKNGVRMIWAKCEACGHQADVNVDALGSGLIDQSQKATAAAIQIADK
jgi:hypothetical protein